MPRQCREVWPHPPRYSVLVQAAEVVLAPIHGWGNRGSGMESYLPAQLEVTKLEFEPRWV